MIQDAGVEAIINDNLVGGVLTSGCFLGAIATGIVGAVVGGIFVGGESGWILGVSLGVVVSWLAPGRLKKKYKLISLDWIRDADFGHASN